jgi:protein SCO1/2
MKKFRFTRKDKKQLWFLAAKTALSIVLGLGLASLLILWQTGKDTSRHTEVQDIARKDVIAQATPSEEKNIGGAFTLVNQDGKTVTAADYHGYYQLVYFGYTYCPDMCPTGLQSIAHAMDQLGTDITKLRVLFVTVDPARDTPEKLKEYVASFHKGIDGLTGTPEQVAVMAKNFHVFYKKNEQVDDHDYLVDHSSQIYLMSPADKFLASFPENVDPKLLVDRIKSFGRK